MLPCSGGREALCSTCSSVHQARKVEGELEGRLAAYAKLCSAFVDGAYRGRGGEAGLATDQARSPASPCCFAGCSVASAGAPFHLPEVHVVHPPAAQLAAAKRGEIEELLGRLSDVNEEMGSAVSGAGDSRAHTLTRHREIMVELTQVSPAAEQQHPSCSSA